MSPTEADAMFDPFGEEFGENSNEQETIDPKNIKTSE